MPAKTRYLRKLNLLELDDTDDPYCDATASKFRDDMMLWPSVEFGNVFCYFVSRPGLLKSLVNPSQKSPDDAHHCWVAVNGDGTVVN